MKFRLTFTLENKSGLHKMIVQNHDCINGYSNRLLGLFTVSFFSGPPKVIFSSINPSNRSFTMSWQRPSTSCVVTAYYIYYDGAAKWGNGDTDIGAREFTVEDDQDIVIYLLDNLQPYSTYTLAGAGGNFRRKWNRMGNN